MGYRETRWPKILFGTIALGSLAAFFGASFWHPVKEQYFDFVATSCSEEYGLERIPWQWVPSFDVRVEQFAAATESEIAVRDCIRRRAGVIMTDRVSAHVSYPTIEFALTDNHRDHLELSSPPRQVYYSYLQPAE